MSAKKSVVKVTIVGEEYTIRSDAPPDHTRAVAAYVDGAIRKVLDAGNMIESHKAAILAALQITDELFRARAADDNLAAEMRALAGDIRRWVPPTKRGTPSEGSGTTSA